MPNRKFKATEGLLHDVMRKQSGVIEKAWLEALMNSVDANATEFRLSVTENESVISDDGDSMTEEQVDQYFEQFGLKDSDIQDKDFGKFRMGRGQIFNFGVNVWRAKENYMVVSLDSEKTTVDLPDCTDTDDESIIDQDGETYTVNTEGLSYALLDAKAIDSGLHISVQHYQPISNLDNTIDEFKELAQYVGWFHDVEVYVNDELLDEKPEVIEETELAYYIEGKERYYNDATVYNIGAKVDSFDLGPGGVDIISKSDLDVTLDRTDILDTDPYWTELQKEHKVVNAKHLASRDNLGVKDRNWLVEQSCDSKAIMELIADKPLFKTLDGDMLTVAELQNEKIGFASVDDEVAKDAMSRGQVVMLDEKHKSSFKELQSSAGSKVSGATLKEYEDIIDEELQFEMKETPDHELSKRRRKHLAILRSALSDLGLNNDIKAGYSNHKEIWKDQDGTVFIHKESLNCKRQELATHILQKTVVVAAHDGETMTSLEEDYSLNRNFYKAVSGSRIGASDNYAGVQNKILNSKYT